MEIATYLKKYQPAVYQTFSNALTKNKLSHAYLLCGSPGMPLLDVAIYLAKTLLCDNPNPLACQTCLTCLRVDEGNYTDLIIVDGKKGKIKKGDIEQIENSFDKTSIENKGKMIYILNLVENTTPIALNSLLKFLEEPGENVYAFLTTENEAKLLPTIISRTQVLHFLPVPRKDIIEDALNVDVPLMDAELLSAFHNDGLTIANIANDELYKNTKSIVDDFLDYLIDDKDDAVYYMQKVVSTSIRNYEQIRLFVDLLAEIFENLLAKIMNGVSQLSSYDKILDELSKQLKHVDSSLLTIVSARSMLDVNVNIPLLLDYIAYKIIEE